MAQYTNQGLIKAELQTTTDFDGTTIPSLTQVTTWIEEESEQVDLDAGRTFGSQDYTDIFDYRGEELLTLTHSPATSINSVLYTTSALGTTNYGLTNTAVQGTDYDVYLDSGEIIILSNKFKTGNKSIQVNYTAGYEQVPKIVQKLTTKLVTKRVLDSVVQGNMEQGNVGGSISVGNINIVEPENLSISTYKVLNGEIERLRNDLKNRSGVYRYSRW